MEIQSKDELLEQTSLAVEQIQKQFVQGGSVITDCQETFFLCQCVNSILHHGLKEGLISWAMEPSIWPLLEKITCGKDIQEIKMLHLKTDQEKCSTWIKMAVNENLLGSYIATINQDQSLLSNHYYEYAFLRDPIMADTVKSLLNYGITNFDFQIAICQDYPLYNEVDITAKQGFLTRYDAIAQTVKSTKGNCDDLLKPELELTSTQETWSKKKRRKKKQPVKTVVIEEQNDHEEFGEAEDNENENVGQTFEENGQKSVGTNENRNGLSENGKPLRNTDDTENSNSVERSLVNCDPSGGDMVDNVITGSSSNSHVSKPANDYKVDWKENQSDCPQDTSEKKSPFVRHDLNERFNSSYNSETKSQNKERSEELNSLGKVAQKSNIPQEFRANDFLLDQRDVQPQNIVRTSCKDSNSNVNLKDNSERSKVDDNIGTYSSTVSQENFSSGKENSDSQKCESDSSLSIRERLRYTKLSEDSINSTNESSINSTNKGSIGFTNEARALPENSWKNEHHSDGNEDFLSHTPNSKDYNSSFSTKSGGHGTAGSRKELTDEISEVSTSGNSYDYRVRKVENPEFISSSYSSSSALSDLTDDDRDLNFIPGIHRMSSKSFFSSIEKKSSVSFDENGFPVFDSSHYTESSSSRASSIDDGSKFADTSNDWDMFEDLLNVDEEHFSTPDNFAGLTTSEELEMAIEHYKKMVRMTKQKSQQRSDLVQKLVKLRMRLQQEKEGPPVENANCRKIVGHVFTKKEGSRSGTKYFCDQCGKNIWSMWQSLFTCNGCGYHSHRKCLEHIQRPCPNKNLSSVSYILDICPDAGLDAQQYRCAECRKEIAFSKEGVAEARICDYTGQYFCDGCHWNDQMSMPARILRNWDFTQYKVCRKTKQLLELIKSRPVINIQDTNPMLYRYVGELREVNKLREDILIMKKYFLTCREALESKLLMQLQKRQHFVDSAHTYSFQDLVDLNNDVLLPEVSKVHALFLAHIKADCELCRARGFICEVCRDSSDIIFAFDPHAVKCINCSGVFHKICFKPQECPKCERKRKMANKS